MENKEQVSIVFNTDCLEYMKGLPDKFFELAIVDPPYGISVNMNMGRRKGKAKRHIDKKWDSEAPEVDYFIELLRVSNNQIIWGANHFISRIPYDSSCWLIWDKGETMYGRDFAEAELAYSSFLKPVRRFKLSPNQVDRIHPTQKPVALYKWILQNYAKPGEKIFDSHMGSQSSRLAAYEMGFDYYGCELDKDYFDSGNKRFEDFRKQQSLFAPQELSPVSLGGNLFANDGNKPNKTLK